jgi:hypothetical protein
VKNLRKLFARNWERLTLSFLRLRKGVYQYCLMKKTSKEKNILFIIGCQRSGTNLMQMLFERDFHTKVYGEFSRLSSGDARHKIRLNPLHLVRKEIGKNRASFIILKPLVETQNTPKLLRYFNGSKALWMYRNYKDVAASNLSHFGVKNGLNNLRAIGNNEPQNWRSENMSYYTKEIVMKYFSEDMNPYDAAALFWFARNRLFFELELEKNPRVMMCRYENLVTDTVKVMQNIYNFMGYTYSPYNIPGNVHANSLGHGKEIVLSPEIDLLCYGLLHKLDAVYQSKQYCVQ